MQNVKHMTDSFPVARLVGGLDDGIKADPRPTTEARAFGVNLATHAMRCKGGVSSRARARDGSVNGEGRDDGGESHLARVQNK